jgi:Contractile injection system tube protein
MTDLARAYFIRTADESGGSATPASEGSGVSNAPATVPANAVAVQFNPLTLQYGLTINNPQAGADPKSTQHVARAEATLEMDLIFDTTHEGTDVRALTVPVRNLAMSGEASSADSATGTAPSNQTAEPAPSKVAFVWGTLRFVGVVSGFRETLDFFSAEGVPLRSGVHVSMRGTQNSEAFTAPDRQATLGNGLSDSLGNLGKQNAGAGRMAGAALGAPSIRAGLGVGVGGGGGSAAVKLGASVSVVPFQMGSAQAHACDKALGQLAKLNTQTQTATLPSLGGQFGFGGVSVGTEPSGLRSNLGVLAFLSSNE